MTAHSKSRVARKTEKPRERQAHRRKLKHQLTAQERSVVTKNASRWAGKTAARMKLLNDGEASEIAFDHPDQVIGHVLLMEALGIGDFDFFNGLLNQLVFATRKGGQIDEADVNFMLSVIKDIKPKDQLEAMLAAQIAAVHVASIRLANQLAHAEDIPRQDSAERAFNKLTRTFVAQMEALKRYRAGGEQTVTVQNVSVSEGGQAIVGNVTQTPRENRQGATAAAASPLAISDARTAPMPVMEESKQRATLVRRGQK